MFSRSCTYVSAKLVDAMALTWIACLSFILLQNAQGDLLRKRPLNGLGKLLISEDTKHSHYNKHRLMVFFDLNCLENQDTPAVAIELLHSDPINKDSTDKSSRLAKIQSLKVNSLIDQHFPCLNRHFTKDTQHNIEYNGIQHNIGISFLDISHDDDQNNKDRDGTSCINDESITLDYNAHCIDMFSYEPIFRLNAIDKDLGNFTALTSDDYNCITQDTSNETLYYGLDQSDSYNLTGNYIYPNISIDNGVDMYIIDGGILDTHVEFANVNIIHELGDGPDSRFIDDENTTYWSSHGSHVAGIAVGETVGHAKRIGNVYDYKVCVYELYNTPSSDRDTVCYYALIIQALEMVNERLSNNQRRGVINMSLGGGVSFYSIIFDAYFEQININGGIVAVAAGNDYEQACEQAPAYSANVITVGNVGASLELVGSSNDGYCVDVWASGNKIWSAMSDGDTVYDFATGTSMSSPAIAGMIANILWLDPSISFDDMKRILVASSRKLTDDSCATAYDCYFPLFDCNVLPSVILAEAEPVTEIDFNQVFEGIENPNNCEYVAMINLLNPTFTNYSTVSNSVRDINFLPLNYCFNTREDPTRYWSYKYRCINETTLGLYHYNYKYDCDADLTDEENGAYLTNMIKKGDFYNNYWFDFDCSEGLTDCAAIYRRYALYESDDECPGFNKSLTAFADGGFVTGMCYFSSQRSNYEYSCDNTSGIYRTQNHAIGNGIYTCEELDWGNIDILYWYEPGCDVVGLLTQVTVFTETLVCNAVEIVYPTSSPSMSPTNTPSMSPTVMPSVAPTEEEDVEWWREILDIFGEAGLAGIIIALIIICIIAAAMALARRNREKSSDKSNRKDDTKAQMEMTAV